MKNMKMNLNYLQIYGDYPLHPLAYSYGACLS